MTTIFISLLLAAALHDLGHLICAKLIGVKVSKWRVFYIVREPGTDMQNMLITAAGPMVNLILAGSIFLCPWWGLTAIDFGMANFGIGIINLIPMRLTDGHRLLAIYRRSKNVDRTDASV